MPDITDDILALLEGAREAARLGGSRLCEGLGRERQVSYKGGIDLVTDADRASEEAIVSFLQRRFPGHAVLAEERGDVAGSAPYRWIVDPLDGTTNYAHRVPHFCVSIAVEDKSGLAAGAVYDPIRDELFSAGRGLGADLNGAPMRVSAERELQRGLLATGFPYNVWSQPDRPLALFDRFIRRSQGVRRAGSAALDLSYVASGRFDGFFELNLKPWDIAAGALLVREAGGIVTDLDGGPLVLTRGDLIASNGAVHETMVQIATEALGPHTG